jgi:hypothetical protein
MLHEHGLESIPVRLPIPLFILVASFLLWRLRRQWFYLELLLLIPTALWLGYNLTKSSRYFAIVAPIFALVIAAAVAATSTNRKLHGGVLAFSCMIVVAQMAANIFLLHAARDANYNKVAAELRSVIPPGQTAYGSITFWLALHDYSFISQERTDPWMAADQFHARYFITGYRVTTLRSTSAAVDALDKSLHARYDQSIARVIAQSKLIGHFPDLYYGDLKVYELHAP